jgi:hypothetical protein
MKNNYKLWIIFSFVMVFAAGIFSGIILEKHILDKKIQIQTDKSSRSQRGSSVRFPTLDDMAKELGLSQEQQEEIRAIFKQSEEKLKKTRGEIHKQFSSMRKQLLDDIKSVLDQEQNLKFEAMIERYLSQRREAFEKRKRRSNQPRSPKREAR